MDQVANQQPPRMSPEASLMSRNDLAWAIAVGGIGTVALSALLVFTWYFAATLFLIFAGILFGVFLNAITELLGRVVGGGAWRCG